VAGGDGWAKMNGYEKFQFCFTGVLGTATVLILVWFAWITCKKMKELGRQEKEEEERLAAEGGVVVNKDLMGTISDDRNAETRA